MRKNNRLQNKGLFCLKKGLKTDIISGKKKYKIKKKV